MKVAKWYNNADIRIEEQPTPQPGNGEMLVKVIACGICGSDIVEWYRLPRAPLVQGHEIGAEVVAVGKSVNAYAPGDRVFIAPKIPCMSCPYCDSGHYPVCPNVKERLPGGFAEFILVPQTLVKKGTYLLPERITYDQSTFIEPLACAVRAQGLAGVKAGQRLLVMGCGMSGLLHIKLALAMSCRVIATDTNAGRREMAARLGAELTIDATQDVPARLDSAGMGKVDVVLICTSAISAIEQAWQCVDKGGAIVFYAVPGPDQTVTIPINGLWTSEVRILTSYYCGPPDLLQAIDLIEKRTVAIDDLVTHVLPLDDIVRGFRLVVEGNESLKVIIHPHET